MPAVYTCTKNTHRARVRHNCASLCFVFVLFFALDIAEPKIVDHQSESVRAESVLRAEVAKEHILSSSRGTCLKKTLET